MLRIKVCGLTTCKDAEAAIGFGADALGFNFYPGSKRYLPPETRAWIGRLPEGVERIAILVNPTLDEARTIAALEGINALQLHGQETPEFCRRLKDEGIRFEKAIAVTTPQSLKVLPNFSTQTLLLDSGGPAEFGGSGHTFPWAVAQEFVQGNPQFRVILAGGLNPDNVAEAVALVKPYGVDVTTGVESAPGRKDPALLRAFIAAARRL